MRIHPPDRFLNLFADRELGGRLRPLVAAHLLICERCRAVVHATQELQELAEAERYPAPPSRLRVRIIESVVTSAETSIPLTDPPRSHLALRSTALVGATIMVVFALVAIQAAAPGRLVSDASALWITPTHPPMESVVEVTYRASGLMRGNDRLSLRARFRHGDNVPFDESIRHEHVADLERDADGLYRGTLALPPGVVYAAVAVEDPGAEHVDAHAPIGYEILTHLGPTPTLPALVQQGFERVGRDRVLALRGATRAAKLYPDSLTAWVLLSAAQREVLFAAELERVRWDHVTAIRTFDARLRERPAPAPAEQLYYYALGWGEGAIAQYWSTWIEKNASDSRMAVMQRVLPLLTDPAISPPDRAWGLDDMRADIRRHPDVRDLVFSVVSGGDDPWQAMEFARDIVLEQPERLPVIAKQLQSFTVLADTLDQWFAVVSERLAEVDDLRRPLHRTRMQQARIDQQRRREILGARGRTALALGFKEKGRAWLDSATSTGWAEDYFLESASAHLLFADTAAAVMMLANAAVGSRELADHLAHHGAALVGPTRWGAELEHATARMVEFTLSEALSLPIVDSLHVMSEWGDRTDLRSEFGDVTVISLLWPTCQTCRQQLVDLRSVLAQGSHRPKLLVVVLDNGPSDGVLPGGPLEVEVPLFFDAEDDVVAALQEWGTGGVFVIDRHQIVRFRNPPTASLPRIVMALLASKELVS